MKSAVFFILGAAIAYVYALLNSSTENRLYISAAGALFGGLIEKNAEIYPFPRSKLPPFVGGY